MAATETTLNELGEMLGYVGENMATKNDIKDMATKALSSMDAPCIASGSDEFGR
jgi:hypothetical protein